MSLTAKVARSSHEIKVLFNEFRATSDSLLSFGLCTSEAWLTQWLKHYLTPQDELFVCCHYHGNECIALYPLYLKKIAFGYELRFLGSGEPEQADVASEFQDFVIAADYLHQSLTLFSQQVKTIQACYRIRFELILPESNCFLWFYRYKKRSWLRSKQLIGKRYLIKIATDDKQQVEQLARATLRRYARRFSERSDIRIEFCTCPDDIPLFFEELIQLHNAQWSKRGKQGAFSSQQFQKFHQGLSAELLDKNQLLLYRMKFNGHTIAVFYGFYYDTTVYYYQSGISAASPLANTGIALHLTSMRQGRIHKCTHYDLMKGGLLSYKNDYVQSNLDIYTLNYTQPLLWVCQLAGKMIRKISSSIKSILQLA